jgi:hypothetical protein
VVSVEIRRNIFTAHAQGKCSGEHHSDSQSHRSHSSLMSALSDCSVLISRGMGPRLFQELMANGIGAVVCTETEALEAAKMCVRGELTAVDGSTCPSS